MAVLDLWSIAESVTNLTMMKCNQPKLAIIGPVITETPLYSAYTSSLGLLHVQNVYMNAYVAQVTTPQTQNLRCLVS